MFFDSLIGNIWGILAVIAVCGAGLPQLYLLWKSKSSQNISLTMWTLLFFGLSYLWLREIFVVQNPLIIIQLSFSEFVNLSVIILVSYFRYVLKR